MSHPSPLHLLAALRLGDGAEARALLAADADDRAAVHTTLRAAVAGYLIESLLPTDRPLARWLLEQEVRAHQQAGHGASQTLVALVAALARFGQPDDALLIWQARTSTPEAREAVDVEQLGRAGVAQVEAWLEKRVEAGSADAPDARQALQWLREGETQGAFTDLAGYFAWSDEQAGLIATAPA